MDEKEAEARPVMGTIFLVIKAPWNACYFDLLCLYSVDTDYGRDHIGLRPVTDIRILLIYC